MSPGRERLLQRLYTNGPTAETTPIYTNGPGPTAEPMPIYTNGPGKPPERQLSSTVAALYHGSPHASARANPSPPATARVNPSPPATARGIYSEGRGQPQR